MKMDEVAGFTDIERAAVKEETGRGVGCLVSMSQNENKVRDVTVPLTFYLLLK